jgi:hypothetical protein
MVDPVRLDPRRRAVTVPVIDQCVVISLPGTIYDRLTGWCYAISNSSQSADIWLDHPPGGHPTDTLSVPYENLELVQRRVRVNTPGQPFHNQLGWLLSQKSSGGGRIRLDQRPRKWQSNICEFPPGEYTFI